MEAGFRQATPDDLERTFEIKRQAFGPYIDAAFGWDEEDQWGRHREEFASGAVRMVMVDGEAVGTVLVRKQPDSLYLSQIFILPTHQSRGIGAACMRMIEEEARQMGVSLKFRVLNVNPRAQAFYKRLGFRPVAQTDTHVEFES